MGYDLSWCPSRLHFESTPFLPIHQWPNLLHPEQQDPHVSWWHIYPVQLSINCRDTGQLTRGYEAVCTWMNPNKLRLNSAKTSVMLIGTRQRVCGQRIDVVVNNHIPKVLSTKYLGVMIDSHAPYLGTTCELRDIQSPTQAIRHRANVSTPKGHNNQASQSPCSTGLVQCTIFLQAHLSVRGSPETCHKDYFTSPINR